MKRAIVVSILLLAASVCVGQETGAQAPASTSMLIALENAWNQAQLHHDSKALEALIADTFISTDNDGVLMTKSQFLADNRDPSYEPTLMANTDVKVFLYNPGMAVVAGIYHAKGKNAGKPFDHYGRFTDTWVHLNGKWLCVASHTSNLKKTPAKEQAYTLPMPNFQLRFAGVELYFEDLPRAKEFYCDLLGLKIEEDDPAHHAKFRLGEQFLCLEKKRVEDYPSLDKAVLFFEVDNLAELVTKVGPKRIVQTGPQAGPLRWVVLHDPEGHNILVLQK